MKKVKHNKRVEESLSYTVEVRDKEGRLLERISEPSHSYVQAWNQMINTHAKAIPDVGPYLTIKDVDGVNQSAYAATDQLGATAIIGDLRKGIRIGKGTTAVAIADYALESPCDEGTGVDEFEHQAMTFTAPSVAVSTCSFTMRRVMVNNSGATISGIKEIGCYNGYLRTWATSYVLGFRDVLPSAVYVPHGGSITVTYTIKVTV